MDTIKLSSSEKETLAGRGYNLISKIGEGAYAQVYLGTYKDSPYKLACKIVDIPKSSATYVNKFLPRELNILMAIKCPHIVHIHSIFRRNLKYFIFMRYAENGDLMDWIIANGAVPQTQSKYWTKQIVAGMQYLHNNCIAHRDIKCENILITAKNNIKLTDFGFSRYIIENDSKVSFSETFCGSLLYVKAEELFQTEFRNDFCHLKQVAPEIVKGVAYNPFKSDMWSLGVVLFTMVNCKVPFNETNPSLIYELQMSQKYRFQDRNPILAEVKNLIKRLLQPEPKRRPSVDDVLEHKWLVVDATEGDVKTNNNLTEVKKTCEPKMKEPAKSSVEDIMKTDDSLSDDVTKNKKETSKPDGKEVVDGEKREETVVEPPKDIQVISESNIDVD